MRRRVVVGVIVGTRRHVAIPRELWGSNENTIVHTRGPRGRVESGATIQLCNAIAGEFWS